MSTRNALLAAVTTWWLLCGCALLPDSSPPPVEYEGCTNDHADFWRPSAEGVSIIIDDASPASAACNKLLFHSGSGGQGGDVFHIEPGLHIAGEDRDLSQLSVTWDIYALDGTHIGGQGFEVFDYELKATADGVNYWSPQLFIGPDERGKNLRLVATTSLPTDDGAEVQVQAEAAVYTVEVIE